MFHEYNELAKSHSRLY